MIKTVRTTTSVTFGLAAAIALTACGGGGDDLEASLKPNYVGNVTTTDYDGVSNDLLSAGLGRTGLGSAVAPTVSATPTAAELRRLAIWNNYRALVDATAAGGYGTFYGPNVDANGVAGTGEGLIAGTEVIAYSDDGTGARNVTLMVQIPSTFNPASPCIMTATSSGSRGVYGGISTGEWGLKRGCAVAYTGQGHRCRAARPAERHRAADRRHPFHGRSGRHVGAVQGRAQRHRAGRLQHRHAQPLCLQACALAAQSREGLGQLHPAGGGVCLLGPQREVQPHLRQRIARARIRPENTVVIASSISNGGGAAIAAAEIDRAGLIDGVAVAEPAVELPAALG